MSEPRVIYLIAGEASGDLLGAHLMRALKKQSDRPLRFHGIGGDRMKAEGLVSLFPYQDLSLLGFTEVLPHIMRIFARINTTVEDVITKHPETVVTIDVPGFSFRVVEKLREEGFKANFIHYVAPTVWAYKPERANICADLFDKMMVLLPFEPPYFKAVNLPCTWVGHPVVKETAVGDGTAFRKQYNIAEHTTLLTLLPGSRQSEIKRHMPVFAQTATLLAQQYPDIALATAVPRNMMPFVADYFKDCPFRAVVTANEQDKKNAIAAANLAIVKSGTVTLEVAMAKTPMVIAYRVNPISAWMFRRISLTRYVNLINIMKNKEIYPEMLQELCSPIFLANAGAALLRSKELSIFQRDESVSALEQLCPPDDQIPSILAANVVLHSPTP